MEIIRWARTALCSLCHMSFCANSRTVHLQTQLVAGYNSCSQDYHHYCYPIAQERERDKKKKGERRVIIIVLLLLRGWFVTYEIAYALEFSASGLNTFSASFGCFFSSRVWLIVDKESSLWVSLIIIMRTMWFSEIKFIRWNFRSWVKKHDGK